jgi:hypothetical protein
MDKCVGECVRVIMCEGKCANTVRIVGECDCVSMRVRVSERLGV